MWNKIIERFKSVVISHTKQSSRYVAVKQINVTISANGAHYVLSIDPDDMKNFKLWVRDIPASNELIARVFNEVVNVVDEPESMKG